MPRTIPAGLQTHLEGGVLTLATLWKLTTTAAVVYGYTSHVADLVEDGVTYTSAQGVSPTSLKITLGQGVDNFNVMCLFTSTGITESDLRAGTLDGAVLDMFIVNYRDVAAGRIALFRGRLGNVTLRNGEWEAECRGLIQHARQPIGMIASPVCRWNFGGAECGIDPATDTGTVTSRTNDREFASTGITGAGDGFYAYGIIEFTSGLNDGRRMEVKKYTSATGALELTQAMPFTVAIGDAFTIYEGCDGLWPTCKAKSNSARFGGEPHVPGLDKVLRRPPG